jgi:hypothetical protein
VRLQPGITCQNSVRRRYSDFEAFRDILIREGTFPDIPAIQGPIVDNLFVPEIIEARRHALELWLNIVVLHLVSDLAPGILTHSKPAGADMSYLKG